MAKLEIIIASTRPGRVGPHFAEWFEAEARAHSGFEEIEVVDLAEVNLPFFDEPNHPMMRQYTHEHTKRWSAKVDGADAFVFVMPEYNYGFNAELKNALDFLHHEWNHKPVGLLSYGGVSAGTRAAQMLKQVLTTLKMYPLASAVSVPFFPNFLSDGKVTPNDEMTSSAKKMLDELVRTAEVLRPLRQG